MKKIIFGQKNFRRDKSPDLLIFFQMFFLLGGKLKGLEIFSIQKKINIFFSHKEKEF